MGQQCCSHTPQTRGDIAIKVEKQMGQAAIVLYMHELSMPSRAIKSLLVAGDVRYEERVLDTFAGEHKTPEIMALNPSGTIPFITIDGKPYLESQAILRLLS